MAQVERLLAPKPGPATVFLCSGPFSKLIACHTTQHSLWASHVAQLLKNPPVMRETWVRSLGWQDPLEEGKATHSSILV